MLVNLSEKKIFKKGKKKHIGSIITDARRFNNLRNICRRFCYIPGYKRVHCIITGVLTIDNYQTHNVLGNRNQCLIQSAR